MAQRTFPPLYTPSGDSSVDRLTFVHVLERLKTQKRTGWVNNSIPDAESISDHMYRMAVLAMCSSDISLDISKCVMMCIVHDLAEAQVGDIAPKEGISKETKQQLESEAMHNFVHDMLHDSPAAQRIQALWHVNSCFASYYHPPELKKMVVIFQEYEQGQTPEAKFVKDLDRFEMASQALEYEKRHKKSLQPFFDSSIPKLNHPEVKQWGSDLLAERSKHRESGENPSNQS